MRLFKSVLTISLVFFVLCSFAQIEATTNDGKKVVLYKNGTWKYAKTSAPAKTVNSVLKQEALEFSQLLVRSFFKHDCTFIQKSLSPEVFTFKNSISITEEIKSRICESVNRAVTDSSKTFDDYVATYKMELFSKAELEAKYKTTLPLHYNSTNEEFYFIGFEQKSEVKSNPFIAERLFALLIRKEQGSWVVKGFLED